MKRFDSIISTEEGDCRKCSFFDENCPLDVRTKIKQKELDNLKKMEAQKKAKQKAETEKLILKQKIQKSDSSKSDKK